MISSGLLKCPISKGNHTENSFPTPDLPDPGIKVESLASPALAGRFFTTTPPGKPFVIALIDFQKSSIYYGKSYLNKPKEVCVYTPVYLTSLQVFF